MVEPVMQRVRDRTDYRDRKRGVTDTFVWLACNHAYHSENRRKPPLMEAMRCRLCEEEASDG